MSYSKIKRYMDALVFEGNFTRAARRLYISQPYLSRFISELEEDYNAQFFDRSPRSVQLTAAGKIFLEGIEDILNIEQDLKKHLESFHHSQEQRIRLGFSPDMGKVILPLLHPDFNKTYPHIHLDIVEAPTVNLHRALHDRDIDLFLAIGNEESKEFHQLPLFSGQMLFIASPKSVFHQEERTSILPFTANLSLLEEEPLILLPQEHSIQKNVDAFFNQHHLKQDVVLRTSTLTNAMTFVSKGLGSCFIPVLGQDTLGRSPSNLMAYSCYAFDPELFNYTVYAYSLQELDSQDIYQDFCAFISDTVAQQDIHQQELPF